VPPRVLEPTGRTIEEGDWEMDRIVSLPLLPSYESSDLSSYLSAWTTVVKRMKRMKYNNIFNIFAIKYKGTTNKFVDLNAKK
jgi:hypothetical protein